MTLDAVACALFLMAAFVMAGAAHVAWLRCRLSQALAIPIDGGLMWRGRRLLGDNKTIRGLVGMVPATALSFVLLLAAAGDPERAGLWSLPPSGYAALGGWAGLGFMLGELPNSFVKRQLGIPPGGTALDRQAATWQFLGDRLDSIAGTLAALALVVPVPLATSAILLVAGPALHLAFSTIMFLLGLKARPA